MFGVASARFPSVAVLPYETRLLLSLTNAVGAGRMRQAARELVKAYIHGVKSAALDDVFELLAWNQGIGFFSSEIGPSALFQAYKLIKNGPMEEAERVRAALLDAGAGAIGNYSHCSFNTQGLCSSFTPPTWSKCP